MPRSDLVAADLVLPDRLDPYSLARLEQLLGIPRERLRTVGARAGSYYDPFLKRDKERPFRKTIQASKSRTIDNPIGELKIIQRQINAKILKPVVFPRHVCGGVGGKTILDNVMLHLGAPVLVTMDIKSFFPSVSNCQVYDIWNKIFKFSPNISALLTKLTTFERHLPQGAPTSTSLANLVLFSVDGLIRAECARHSVRYSTWVDDLAFSGADARIVINLAVKVLRGAGFRIPHRKMKVMGRGTRKVLNGVLLGKFPTALPDRLAQLRSGIHKFRTGEVPSAEARKYIRSLDGKISYVASLTPKKAQELARDLEDAKEKMLESRGNVAPDLTQMGAGNLPLTPRF